MAPCYHTAALLKNGTVLVGGGFVDLRSDVTASAELYQPTTLTPVGLASITINQSTTSISPSGTQHFTATGVFSDSSTQTLASATWSSSASSVATISNDAGNYGNAVAVALGTATISACTGTIWPLATPRGL